MFNEVYFILRKFSKSYQRFLLFFSGPGNDIQSVRNTADLHFTLQKIGLSVCMYREAAGTLEFHGTAPEQVHTGQDSVDTQKRKKKKGYD